MGNRQTLTVSVLWDDRTNMIKLQNHILLNTLRARWTEVSGENPPSMGPVSVLQRLWAIGLARIDWRLPLVATANLSLDVGCL